MTRQSGVTPLESLRSWLSIADCCGAWVDDVCYRLARRIAHRRRQP